MIVICPSCHNKYSVQPEAIGEKKLVRCAVCNAMWTQLSSETNVQDNNNASHIIKWTVLWFSVFISIFSLIFAKEFLIKSWPPIIEFYKTLGAKTNIDNKKNIIIKNVSNFFVQKKDGLYIGVRGDLLNISENVKIIPSMDFLLKNDISQIDTIAEYQKQWTHNLSHKKLLPNQKINFETELQKVPYNNLICDIILNTI